MKIKNHFKTLYAIIAMSMIISIGTTWKYNYDTMEALKLINNNQYHMYMKTDSIHQVVRSLAFWKVLNGPVNSERN